MRWMVRMQVYATPRYPGARGVAVLSRVSRITYFAGDGGAAFVTAESRPPVPPVNRIFVDNALDDEAKLDIVREVTARGTEFPAARRIRGSSLFPRHPLSLLSSPCSFPLFLPMVAVLFMTRGLNARDKVCASRADARYCRLTRRSEW